MAAAAASALEALPAEVPQNTDREVSVVELSLAGPLGALVGALGTPAELGAPTITTPLPLVVEKLWNFHNFATTCGGNVVDTSTIFPHLCGGRAVDIWWKNIMELWWKSCGNMKDIFWKSCGNPVEI